MFPFTGYVNYEIFNELGQLVAKGEVVNNQIDVSDLESAVYRVKFRTEGRTITKRFIKQ